MLTCYFQAPLRARLRAQLLRSYCCCYYHHHYYYYCYLHAGALLDGNGHAVLVGVRACPLDRLSGQRSGHWPRGVMPMPRGVTAGCGV